MHVVIKFTRHSFSAKPDEREYRLVRYPCRMTKTQIVLTGNGEFIQPSTTDGADPYHVADEGRPTAYATIERWTLIDGQQHGQKMRGLGYGTSRRLLFDHALTSPEVAEAHHAAVRAKAEEKEAAALRDRRSFAVSNHRKRLESRHSAALEAARDASLEWARVQLDRSDAHAEAALLADGALEAIQALDEAGRELDAFTEADRAAWKAGTWGEFADGFRS